MSEQMKSCKLAERFNALVGYEAIKVDECEPLTAGKAAELLAKGLHISHETLESTCCALKALKNLDLMPAGVDLTPDTVLTEDVAEAWMMRATRAKIIVTEDSAVIDRETAQLEMAAPAKRIDGVLYVPVEFGAKGLGGCAHGELPFSVVVNNKSFEDAAKFVVVDGVPYMPLAEVCQFFGAESIVEEGKVFTALFDRITLKSNRDLNERERTKRFTDLYLRYWYVPLPERRDEIAWRAKKHLFGRDDNAMENGALLPLYDVQKLLDPNYCDPDGWCRFDDGSAVFSVNTPMPGVTNEMFYWWFAWHGLEDVRYMTWFPPSHFGLWIENRVPFVPAEPFRSFDESLSIEERTRSLVHHVYETFHTSTDGIDLYYKDKADGTNTNKIMPAGPMGLGFININGMGGYFDTEEYNKQSDAGKIASVGVYTPAPHLGAVMCHFFRVGDDGVPVLHSHFWFNCTFDYKTHEYLSCSPEVRDYRTMLFPLSEHCVREFANLAEVLPEIAAQEMGKPLSEGADPNYYAKGVHPNIP